MTLRSLGCLVALALGAAAIAPAQNETLRLTPDDTWRQQSSPSGNEDDAVIERARRALAEDRPQQALTALKSWIDLNKRSSKPQLPEAYRLRGDAQVALGQEFRALYDYEQVCKAFPQSDQYPIAIQRELDIAIEYANGKKRKLWGIFRLDDAGDIAEEIFIRVNERLPGSVLAEQAMIELADYYFRKRDMKFASDAYDLYLINFPDGPNRRHAMERRIYASVAEFNGPRYDATSLLDAREQTRAYAREYPAEARDKELDQTLIDRIDEASAAHMLTAAKWYDKVNDVAGERLTLQRLVHRHPETIAAQTAISILEKKGWLETAPPESPEAEAPAEEPSP